MAAVLLHIYRVIAITSRLRTSIILTLAQYLLSLDISVVHVMQHFESILDPGGPVDWRTA